MTTLPQHGIGLLLSRLKNPKGSCRLNGKPQSARSLIVFHLNAQILQLHQLAKLSGDPLRSGFVSDAQEIKRVLEKIESGEILVIEGAHAS